MNVWEMFGEGNEKLTPHEKFKRGVKSAGYDMDAGAKRLEDLLAKQKAERDAREKQEQKNVSEAQDEVDYDDDYQDMVRRVRDKAKASDALKAQGKEPQTKFNPKTGRYYVDHGQGNEVKENAEELNIGDDVIITGNVEFEGKTGVIDSFGRDKRFVIVNLYNHGKHSFHSSDVSFNDYAGSDEEEFRMQEAGYGRNRGYHQGFASPHAPRLGGRREDDEYVNGPDPVDTTTWYIRANGKIIKDKMGTPYHFRGKEAATKAAQTMMAKSFNAGKKFVLTTRPQDDQPETEAKLPTKDKENRFKAIHQRDQRQDQLTRRAMNNIDDTNEGAFDHYSPMGKDSIHQDRIRSLKNLIAKAKEQGRRTRAQELELELKKLHQGINEFAPPGGDGGDDGFSDETLKRMAAQWYQGDEDPRIEKTLAAAGWEIGQDEGYDDEPGVFVVQAGDVNGDSYMSWPAHELQGMNEAWSQKYKRSINCSHPKGFSQRAHCAGKRKHNESIEMEMVCEDCGMCETHGNLNEIKKGQKDSNGVTKCWPGYHAAGTKKGKNGGQVRNCVPNESIDEAIDRAVKSMTEDGYEFT